MTRYIYIVESKMVTAEEFVRRNSRSRGIDTEDAYRVLERAYATNRERLQHSAVSREF